MADTEKKLEALEQEAMAEASANPQANAPKKNAYEGLVEAKYPKETNSLQTKSCPVINPKVRAPARKRYSLVLLLFFSFELKFAL